MQAYHGRAKACSCSYCCNCHLCHDGGRLGRVKIVTLRVGASAKEGKGKGGGEKKYAFSLLSSRPLPRSFWFAPFSPLFSSFNMRFREQNIGAPEENACTAGYGHPSFWLCIETTGFRHLDFWQVTPGARRSFLACGRNLRCWPHLCSLCTEPPSLRKNRILH